MLIVTDISKLKEFGFEKAWAVDGLWEKKFPHVVPSGEADVTVTPMLVVEKHNIYDCYALDLFIETELGDDLPSEDEEDEEKFYDRRTYPVSDCIYDMMMEGIVKKVDEKVLRAEANAKFEADMKFIYGDELKLKKESGVA